MKKLLCAALTATLLLSMVACGGSGEIVSGNSEKGDDLLSKSSTAGDRQSSKKGWSRMTVYGPNDEVYYWHEYEFGPDGKQTSVTSYGPFGNENGHIDFVYDNQGNRSVDYVTHGVGVSYSNGILQPPELKEETGNVSTSEKEYDTAGNLIKSSYQSSGINNDIVDYRTEYKYDESNKRVCCKKFISDNAYQYTFYEYDEDGNLSAEKNYTVVEDGQLTAQYLHVQVYEVEGEQLIFSYRQEYDYDSEGRQIRRSMYTSEDGSGLPNTYTETEYNEEGSTLKVSEFKFDENRNPVLMEYTVYDYNEQGAAVEYARYAICEGVEMLIQRVEYS